MKVYLFIKLSNDIYVENEVLGVYSSRELASKSSLIFGVNDYEIKEYEVLE